MAQNTAQATKSKAITLKGSAELIGDFFGKSGFFFFSNFYIQVGLTKIMKNT